MRRTERLRDFAALVRASARTLVGRFWWVVVLLPLAWTTLQTVRLLAGWREQAYGAAEIQNGVIGAPLTVLGMLLGVRIIAGEIDRRTLEIAYTVPGGAHRVWTAKLVAAAAMILAAELAVGVVAWTLFSEFPLGALYGAFQAAFFYAVVAMTFSTYARSEATGALLTVAVLVVNFFLQLSGNQQFRISPFFNPEVLLELDRDATTVFAYTVQNRIGFALAIAALIAVSFARAERREKLLG